MKILDSILSLLKLAMGGICVFVTGFLCGINPKNELKYRKRCSKFLTSLIAKDIIIEGKIDPNANLLIGNHTSNSDIPLIENIIPEKIIWVAKKELGEIPIIKYMLTKTDMILVDRNDKRSVLKMLREIKDRTNRGFKVVLFPEGTRNKINPKKMIKWKNGSKAVAEKLNLKVQPFVIVNLPFVFKKKPFRIEKQTLKVIFLPTITPKENPNWFEESKEKIQKVLDREYSKVKSEQF
jgi:1-acyl-sn-glycerol-3-phosphate acyltransferase